MVHGAGKQLALARHTLCGHVNKEIKHCQVCSLLTFCYAYYLFSPIFLWNSLIHCKIVVFNYFAFLHTSGFSYKLSDVSLCSPKSGQLPLDPISRRILLHL